ncbi:MAG: hypothetical protein KGL39_34925 [Patescibacteria group bacterium]|nr:hypothetical protein [Patescibacteria group bacterium]
MTDNTPAKGWPKRKRSIGRGWKVGKTWMVDPQGCVWVVVNQDARAEADGLRRSLQAANELNGELSAAYNRVVYWHQRLNPLWWMRAGWRTLFQKNKKSDPYYRPKPLE